MTLNRVSPVTYRAAPAEAEADADRINLMLRLDHRLSSTRSQQFQFHYLDGSSDFAKARGRLQILNLNYSVNARQAEHKLDWGAEYQFNRVTTRTADSVELGGREYP